MVLQVSPGALRHVRQGPGLMRLCMAATAALLAACANPLSTPSTAAGDAAVVTRTADNTVWATPAAIEAARQAARQAAAERDARVRAEAAAARAAAQPAAATMAGSTAGTAATTGLAAATAPAQRPSAEPGTGANAEAPAPLQRVVYFDYDSDSLRPEAQPMVERRARALLSQPQARLLLEGHADERGGSEYNLALGQRRAQAVLRALVLLGVPEDRLEATSLGSTRPAVEGRDEQAWSQNRRVEIKER
jgi:peptidoglycan-associated lipoprotein